MSKRFTEQLAVLKTAGHRVTPVRRALLAMLDAAQCPMLVEEIMDELAKQGMQPNKTTVYRELEFLMAQDMAQDVDFGEGKKRYERSLEHHHHLICTQCKRVEGVDVAEHELRKQEAAYRGSHGFIVQRHMLEFFGICRQCGTSGARTEK